MGTTGDIHRNGHKSKGLQTGDCLQKPRYQNLTAVMLIVVDVIKWAVQVTTQNVSLNRLTTPPG